MFGVSSVVCRQGGVNHASLAWVVYRADNPLSRTIRSTPRENAAPEAADVSPVSRTADADAATGRDHLDARLLKIAGVCVLGAIMTILDTTVVNVAQRTFVLQFDSTEAIVAWTMTGYT